MYTHRIFIYNYESIILYMSIYINIASSSRVFRRVDCLEESDAIFSMCELNSRKGVGCIFIQSLSFYVLLFLVHSNKPLSVFFLFCCYMLNHYRSCTKNAFSIFSFDHFVSNYVFCFLIIIKINFIHSSFIHLNHYIFFFSCSELYCGPWHFSFFFF